MAEITDADRVAALRTAISSYEKQVQNFELRGGIAEMLMARVLRIVIGDLKWITGDDITLVQKGEGRWLV